MEDHQTGNKLYGLYGVLKRGKESALAGACVIRVLTSGATAVSGSIGQ